MKIIEVKENKKQYLDLLLLADEQEDMVDRYLNNGKMYVLDDNGVKCECVITDKENDILEIKNIATVPEYQGKGYARALIEFIVNNYREQYAILQVGTGDQKLGYSKYDYQNKETDDSRNGYSHKTVTSSMGDIDLDIPRDRRGEFEPQIVKKHQTDISNIEDQVLSMYAKGMTTRDISTHLSNVYGVDASAEMISHMTDRILPIAKEWQNRPLEKKYAIVFMDAIHFHVREDNRTVKKAVYVAIGIRLSGQKEVLGMWIGGNESAKYWLGVLNEIKNRGVEDIMIVSVDRLTGFVDAIHAVFPLAEIQRCIVHQIRYSTKFISYKDIRAFMKDLKLVYKADTEQLALEALDVLEENWGGKYPSSIASWRNNWPQLSTYFKYPGEIRKLIYTTNSIENFNRQLRKVTKSKTIFPTDDSLFKILYLAMTDITKKWTGKTWDWGQTLDQLCIYFGDRIQPEDLEQNKKQL